MVRCARFMGLWVRPVEIAATGRSRGQSMHRSARMRTVYAQCFPQGFLARLAPLPSLVILEIAVARGFLPNDPSLYRPHMMTAAEKPQVAHKPRRPKLQARSACSPSQKWRSWLDPKQTTTDCCVQLRRRKPANHEVEEGICSWLSGNFRRREKRMTPRVSSSTRSESVALLTYGHGPAGSRRCNWVGIASHEIRFSSLLRNPFHVSFRGTLRRGISLFLSFPTVRDSSLRSEWQLNWFFSMDCFTLSIA